MSLHDKSKFYRSEGRLVLYIPNSIVNDSQFPFKTSTVVDIKIDDGKLIIEENSNA